MIHKLTIYNATMACGHFLKGNKPPNRLENLRPIYLLKIPKKILEKIINRLRAYLEGNGVLKPKQYGFRESRGTTMAIAIAYEEIALALANKKQVNVILTYFS